MCVLIIIDRKASTISETVTFPPPLLYLETEGFKIDTMGTYHGMTLKSVTVRSELFLEEKNCSTVVGVSTV